VYGFYIGNKNGMKHLIKKFSMYDIDERVINTFKIDVDQTGPTTKEGFKAIANILKKLGCKGTDDDPFKLVSSMTDSGGAMTREQLATLLFQNGYAVEAVLVITCGKHNTQLQLSVPTLELLGSGKLGKRNVMQLFHTVYALQNLLDIEEWWQVISMGADDATS
jgi:hypothetical protein